MRKSRIPSPQTAEDILGARLRDLKKAQDALAVEEFLATGDPGLSGGEEITAFIPHNALGVATIGTGTGAMSPITAGPVNRAIMSWFILPNPIAVNYISFINSSGGALNPSVGGIGIYDMDGDLIGGFSEETTTPGDVLNTIAVGSFDLSPGEYYLGQTGYSLNTSTTMSVYIVGALPVSTNPRSLYQVGRVRIGSVVTDPGKLPASFDPTALSESNVNAPVLCLLSEFN